MCLLMSLFTGPLYQPVVMANRLLAYRSVGTLLLSQLYLQSACVSGPKVLLQNIGKYREGSAYIAKLSNLFLARVRETDIVGFRYSNAYIFSFRRYLDVTRS